jgi:16S rRNA (cytidine1402-2'-O)-methyltransferase
LSTPETGALILVGTPIGNLGDLSARAIETLRAADVIAAEDTRRTRGLLTAFDIPAGRRLRALHAHNERLEAPKIVALVAAGKRVAYVTDAGMPGIADPGERLVRACVDAGLAIEIVPGPSALIAGLVASGLPTNRFLFEGFLPRKGHARNKHLAAIAAAEVTVVLFESPHRVAATLVDLRDACGPDRQVAVARELTKLHEDIVRGPLGQVVGADADARGEHVIVVAPAPPAPELDDDALDAAARRALQEDVSARDAATAVAHEHGVSKRRAYDAVLRVRRG